MAKEEPALASSGQRADTHLRSSRRFARQKRVYRDQSGGITLGLPRRAQSKKIWSECL